MTSAKCPLCGAKVLYAGLTSLSCNSPRQVCENGEGQDRFAVGSWLTQNGSYWKIAGRAYGTVLLYLDGSSEYPLTAKESGLDAWSPWVPPPGAPEILPFGWRP